MSRFEKMCSKLAARNCYESGASLKEISKQSGKSVQTIRKWIMETGLIIVKNKK